MQHRDITGYAPRRSRRRLTTPTAAFLGAASAVLLAAVPAGATTRAPTAATAAKGPWVIDLSNTSLDNGWRLEMQAAAKLAVKVLPFPMRFSSTLSTQPTQSPARSNQSNR